MSNTNPTNRLSWDRIKLALIPLIGLVLAAVIFRPGKDKATSHPSALPGIRLVVVQPRTRQTESAKRSWPKAKLDEVIAFNPFEPPAAPQSPPPQATAQVADPQDGIDSVALAPPAAKFGKLQAVYQDDRGTVAIVDSRIVRVGDVVDNCRVVEITRQGIVVERQ